MVSSASTRRTAARLDKYPIGQTHLLDGQDVVTPGVVITAPVLAQGDIDILEATDVIAGSSWIGTPVLDLSFDDANPERVYEVPNNDRTLIVENNDRTVYIYAEE